MNIKSPALLILLTYLLGCNAPVKPPKTEKQPPGTDATRRTVSATTTGSMKKAGSLTQNKEYIPWDSVRINGKLPLLTRTEELYKLLGQPDSIITPDPNDICVSYFYAMDKYAYFGDSQFEIHGDSAVVSFVDFRTKPYIELNTPALKLNRNTTLSEIETLFPAAAKRKYVQNVWKVGEVLCISIATSNTLLDENWLLFFRNSKLIRIDHFIPC